MRSRLALLLPLAACTPKPAVPEAPAAVVDPSIAFVFGWTGGDKATVHTVSTFQAEGTPALAPAEDSYSLAVSSVDGNLVIDRSWPEGPVRPDNLLSRSTGGFRIAPDGSYIGLADPETSVRTMATLTGTQPTETDAVKIAGFLDALQRAEWQGLVGLVRGTALPPGTPLQVRRLSIVGPLPFTLVDLPATLSVAPSPCEAEVPPQCAAVSITTVGGDEVLELLQSELPWQSSAYSSSATETLVVRASDLRPFHRKFEMTERYLGTPAGEQPVDTTVHLGDETTWTWETQAP